METSDSEYFESADEDFESDCEERVKQHQAGHQNVSHKIIEPQLCKLKLVEGHESNDDTTQKSVDKNVNDIEKIASQFSRSLVVNEQVIEEKTKCNFNESEGKSSLERVNNLIAPLGDKKDIAVERKLESDTKSSEEKFANKLECRNTIEPFQEPIRHSLSNEINTKYSKTVDENIKIAEIDQKSQVEVKKEDDNLWDDELDWGSEAAKEESQLTKEHSTDSKNEDSGWDDFDVEWDSESPTSSEINKKKQIEYKVSAAKTLPTPTKENQVKENLWDDDDGWEPLEKPEEEKLKENESSWGGWGNWGVTSLLNTATQGVSSLTTHVSQGLSTVLETGIGIPEPEEMARINKLQMEKETIKEKPQTNEELQEVSDDSPSSPVGFGLGNLVSGVSQLTKFVESTGTKVITGGLDTLEAIGKKTVEVLQEGDPGLKKKRAFLKLDTGKPNLSQILREAKERAEEENKELAQRHVEVKRAKNYESLFDDHQGLVHLEALEMLSKLCNIKLQNLNNSLSGEALKDMQETLDQVKELCELPEEEDDEKISTEEAKEIISNAIKEINIPITYDKVFAVCNETDSWLRNINLNFIDDVELHQQAIDTLAQLTAFAVEQFHKTGELLLVKEHRRTADEADSLVQITTTVKELILNEAGKFTDKLSTIKNSDKAKINEHITNIFYEAANSGTYIQDAFQLLIPVLQVGAV